jgi:hypothetical protein
MNRQLPTIPLPDYKPGTLWEHYKGGIYRIVAVGYDSETNLPLVTYRGVNGITWSRPALMWDEIVSHRGASVPRFKPYDDRAEMLRLLVELTHPKRVGCDHIHAIETARKFLKLAADIDVGE